MLLSLAVATWTLGLSRGMKMQPLMDDYGNSVKDIAVILLIIAGAGTLKEVFVATGVDKNISACAHRHCHRSADPRLAHRRRHPRVTGLGHRRRHDRRRAHGAGGREHRQVDPNLMVLAVGAGSLMFSHVNDSGFWMAKEYFNLSLKETLKSWTLMEGIVGVVGIIGVLILEAVLY